MRMLIVCAALALAACAPDGAAPKTASAAQATPAGPAETIEARNEASDHHRDTNVSRVQGLQTGDAKLFGVVGGDPAINGEYLYLAVAPEAPDDDFKVYKLGDFNEWALESESEGSVVIKVSRSWIDDAGEIQTAQERYIVAVPAWAATTTTIAKAQ
ncbi:MAG: hypothetical protein JNM47_13295 [Hyphomonadaceae bacterium]|nr:hypothetical protein [Hyphomonadaceae bacterium]